MIDATEKFWLTFEKALHDNHPCANAAMNVGRLEYSKRTFNAAYTALIHVGKWYPLDEIKAVDAHLRLVPAIPGFVTLNWPWVLQYTHTINQGCTAAITTLNNRNKENTP